jgi:hypothetical protein
MEANAMLHYLRKLARSCRRASSHGTD